MSDPARGRVHHRRVRVLSRFGLHLLPASRLVAAAKRYRCQVTLARPDGPEAPVDSVISVLGLGAGPGEELVLRARGAGASTAVRELAALFAAGLGGDGPADAS